MPTRAASAVPLHRPICHDDLHMLDFAYKPDSMACLKQWPVFAQQLDKLTVSPPELLW